MSRVIKKGETLMWMLERPAEYCVPSVGDLMWGGSRLSKKQFCFRIMNGLALCGLVALQEGQEFYLQVEGPNKPRIEEIKL